MISIILSSRLLMHSSASLSLLLIPSSVFFISVIVFFSYNWLFLIFSISLSTFSLSSSPKFGEHLYDYFFDLFSGKLFILISLVPFLRFLSYFSLWKVLLCLLIFP